MIVIKSYINFYSIHIDFPLFVIFSSIIIMLLIR